MKIINGVAKWVAVFAVGLSAALLVIIFFTTDNRLGPFEVRIVMLIAAGLLAGLTSRLLFHRIHPILQTPLVMAACLLAIVLIDRFYPNDYALEFISQDLIFKNPTINDVSQVILAGLASVPPVWFFRRRKKQASAAPPQPATRSLSRKMTNGKVSITRTLEKLDPRKWKKPVKTSSRSTTSRKSTKSTAAAPVHIAAPKKKKAVQSKAVKAAKTTKKTSARLTLPRKRFGRQDNDVKLKGEEEHRCPYCLELVFKHDQRGVMICPECGTWHHKDCWDVTGSCQVAHRNEL
jgi:ribosomal protein L37AE/L43A